MEKVQLVLGYLKKYHFWLLCIVAILAGMFGWMKARSKLSAEFQTNKSTVSGKFQALKTIQGEPNPPNNNWTEAISALTKQEQGEVAVAWKAVFDAQQKVLNWPTVMPDGFKTWVKANPADAEIPPQWIAIYQTEVVKTEFPKLAKIIDAAPMGEKDAKTAPAAASTPPANAAAAAATPEPPKPQYKVEWENQEKLLKALGMSGARATAFEVRIRQEDLWVIETILKIIAKTNENMQYSSRVKRVEALDIGAATAAAFEKGMQPGHIDRLSDPSAAGGEAAADTGGAADAGGEEGVAPAPDERRYVDAEGKPMASGAWKEEQFRRMPVHLRLVMDQREISRLLAACANSPLPVEVRQLRINPGNAAAAPGKQSQGGNPDSPAATATDAYDVTVEINGIIYIFNPPDPMKLGAEAGDTQAAG